MEGPASGARPVITTPKLGIEVHSYKETVIIGCCPSVRGKAIRSRHLPNVCQLTRFSGFFSPADPDTPQRQEAQIVQSQLDLQ